MPLPEKPRIVNHLYRIDQGPYTKSFANILVETVEAALGLPRSEAEQYAVANLKACWNYVLKRQAENVARGLHPLFKVIDPEANIVQWWGDSADFAGDDGQALLTRLRARPALAMKIDTLTDRQFEAIGCVACQALGAMRFLLTPKTNEGGIDFFAVISPPVFCHLFSGANGSLRIIGQCKKYASAVQDDRVKEFVTTIEDVKHQSPRVEGLVPSWFRTARGPVVGLMIAHSGFQSGAESRARDHGIVLADTLDIAEILALSGRVAGTLPVPERVGFVVTRANEILAPTASS